MLAGLITALPFVCALADYGLSLKSEKSRNAFAVISTFVELALSVCLLILCASGGGSSVLSLRIPHVFTSGLSLKTDGFRAVYSVVTSLMWAFTTLFSQEYFLHEPKNLSRYYFFVLATLGATQGVMLSGDLMTTFLFFELLSLTSFTWVIHEETPGAIRAAYTYLFIAVIGGLVLFFGLALLQNALGTLSFDELPAALDAFDGSRGPIFAAGICILIGFGCKAGMFPVHVWLPKAHPVAPAPASALLSGVLTKVGIYGILMTTLELFLHSARFGWTVLLLGTVTMFLGALLALFSINLKRTLACSSMSQIGFILVGIGMTVLLTAQGGAGEGVSGGLEALNHHSAEALAGTVLHMVNHSLLKLCLFCAAGVVVMNLEELDLNRIRGWGRRRPLLKAAFFLGLLGISGIPLFNGYASKTLLHEAIAAGIHEAGEGVAIPLSSASLLHVIEWVFLVSGGCTFAYMLKLFICVFVEKNADAGRQEVFDRKKPYMSPASALVVFGTALLFPLLGQKPVFGALASFMTGHAGVLEEFRPLSWECVSGGLISLGIGLTLYVVLIRGFLMQKGAYVNRWPEKLDLEDMLYRPLLMKWLPGFFGGILSVLGENKVLKPLFSKWLPALLGWIPSFFGENKLLKPLCRGLLFVLMVIGRAMADGTDALIVLMRRTLLREHVVTGRSQRQLNAIRRRRLERQEAYRPIRENFSYALMLACIGMMGIFGVLLVSVLL